MRFRVLSERRTIRRAAKKHGWAATTHREDRVVDELHDRRPAWRPACRFDRYENGDRRVEVYWKLFGRVDQAFEYDFSYGPTGLPGWVCDDQLRFCLSAVLAALKTQAAERV